MQINVLKTAIYITLLFIIFAGAIVDRPEIVAYNEPSIESFALQKPAISSVIAVSSYGLLSTPDAIYQSIDPFSACKGLRNCESFGLRRSTGNLCLSSAQKQLVYTRGGNFS
jgi:hypothetical protein